jgi:hypothetical protein
MRVNARCNQVSEKSASSYPCSLMVSIRLRTERRVVDADPLLHSFFSIDKCLPPAP